MADKSEKPTEEVKWPENPPPHWPPQWSWPPVGVRFGNGYPSPEFFACVASMLSIGLSLEDAIKLCMEYATGAGVQPPIPGPPEEWPDRPPGWPWPLPWPPVVVYGPTAPPTTTPPPVPPQPPPAPRPPRGWETGTVVTENYKLLNCTKATFSIPEGASARFEISHNEGGDGDGIVEFKVNGLERGPMTGNGNLPPIDGPATVEVHLKGPQNRCRIKITAV